MMMGSNRTASCGPSTSATQAEDKSKPETATSSLSGPSSSPSSPLLLQLAQSPVRSSSILVQLAPSARNSPKHAQRHSAHTVLMPMRVCALALIAMMATTTTARIPCADAFAVPSSNRAMQNTAARTYHATATQRYNSLLMSMSSSFSDNEDRWQNSEQTPANNKSKRPIAATGEIPKPRPRTKRKKYRRKKTIPETEMATRRLKEERQAQYDQVVAEGSTNLWSFEGLFPEPVLDQESIDFDLYEMKRRDATISKVRQRQQTVEDGRDQAANQASDATKKNSNTNTADAGLANVVAFVDEIAPATTTNGDDTTATSADSNSNSTINATNPVLTDIPSADANSSGKVDFELTRLVEDRVYGYRRSNGAYDTSLMGDGAVKFREGVRLSKALPVNAARLNYYAKKELRRDRVEEAQELYEMAISVDPQDGRAYLGLSRSAERRRDTQLAREWLRRGVANSVSFDHNGERDRGANPFLLQSLGVLEEKCGNLGRAEALYLEAIKSRPSHAAGWVALAQLRTRKFRQSAAAGRLCYETASRELTLANKPQSSHVFTAWASMEYKKVNDVCRARELYQAALEIDPKCSAAWLQLGVMETAVGQYEAAQDCYDAVLKFDPRNSRVLQAYAIMETKRENSRKAIDLFERALQANKRDAGVLQAYGVYVSEALGDVDSARKLFRKATKINKRHSPAWQAWGVLETRHGDPRRARDIFQQGIWNCAQASGGRSGGYGCARLWQAWGVLEVQEGDDAAARRCLSRALDADNRNVAAVTAWAQMEEELGNLKEATMVYERFMKQFAPGTAEKATVWRSYELMLQRAGDMQGSREVYQRSMSESFAIVDDDSLSDKARRSARREAAKAKEAANAATQDASSAKKRNREVEVVRWETGSSDMKSEVWMNEGSIEGKVPQSVMDKKSKQTKTKQ